MLFNSFAFAFVFLPCAVAGYYTLLRFGWREASIYFLALASLAFYAVWSVKYAGLLCVSLVINYAIGLGIQRKWQEGQPLASRRYMILGITFNLLTLFYFKYMNFFVDNLNGLTGASFFVAHVILPLGISFYTFQKIALLVDLARGTVQLRGFARFALFVLFFPQLIAGPIVHFKEIAPQFARQDSGRYALANIAVGTAIFAIGLFKKTVLADTAVLFSTPVYEAATRSDWAFPFWLSWQAALAYTLQLYFDFSGYSDMAIGLARMFGVKLPRNFHSPHKADNIADYWRRWHMTLQRFLATYLFQPVAMPLMRFAVSADLGRWSTFLVARLLPTMIVFIISGFWHGAGWTFVVWGIMHGLYVSTQEFWTELFKKRRKKAKAKKQDFVFRYFLLTFAAVVASNVMFRAVTLPSALNIYAGMLNIPSMIDGLRFGATSVDQYLPALSVIVIGFLIIFAMPNSQQIMRRYDPSLDWKPWRTMPNPVPAIEWRPNLGYAIATGLVLAFGLLFVVRGQSAFIYFNF